MTPTAPSPIVPGTVYRLDEFQRVSGLGKAAMRTARRQGLRVRRAGGRAFVHADDFIEYLDRLDRDGDS